MATILLVRHGETSWSAASRHTGLTDVPLTVAGEEQARAAGRVAAELLAGRPLLAVLTSPLQRAVRTARLAGLDPADGSTPDVDPDLVERDYGGYEGLTLASIREQEPGWDAWTHDVPPGEPGHPGETLAELSARADRVVSRLARYGAAADDGSDGSGSGEGSGDGSGDAVVAVVAHGHLLRALAARWIGLDVSAGSLLQLDTGGVSALGHVHGRRALQHWNLPT